MKRTWDISSAALHLLAMACMLMDHLWASVLWQQDWLTCVGRLAFPIFAFLCVEGYFHTSNFRRYLLRLLIFALLSEIPFDLMSAGTVFHPFHQNVLWTFLLGLLGIRLLERAREKGGTVRYLLTAFLCVALGYCLSTVTMADYYGAGVLTVFVFYFFRGRTWYFRLAQLAALYWLNVEVLGGQYYAVSLFGAEWEVCEQGLALLALVPIWLYRGRQGYHTKPFQYLCYAFYPVHLLALGLIRLVW